MGSKPKVPNIRRPVATGKLPWRGLFLKNQMKPEDQIIAIAKACGWHHFILNDEYGNDRALRPTESHEAGCIFTDLPDYTADLNAMHEAEKTIDPDRLGVYQVALYGVCRVNPNSILASKQQKVISATAAQRAEAFLHTLNLWREEE